jgi:recombinational DNA repair protein (RecF pathway)
MYQKYQTDAIVLRSYERGEADCVFALYTREFGLVWARASAVRRESSRIRYALQSFSRASVSLVRGSRGWRVTGALSQSHIGRGIAVIGRVTKLLERLVGGEEKNDYLFDTLVETKQALEREPDSLYGAIELVCVARVLYSLGYLSKEAVGSAHFLHTAYSHDALQSAESERAALLSSINRAISESHL